uniref:Thrombopoietin n=1 Tax=Haplochromis burtoni TaxID=8153 RepID=A0A3Q2WDP1_HAPBU
MIASEVWDSETKSTEFVCSRAARKALNIVPKMSSALVRMSLPSSLASRSIYFKEMGCFTTSIWMLYLIRLLSVVTCSQPVHLSVLSLSLVSPVSPPLQSNCNGSATLSTQVQLPCTELHAASWEHKSEREKRGEIVASLRLLVEGVKSERSLRPAGCGALLLQRLENNINNYLLILTRLQLSGAVVTPSLSCVPRSTQSLRTVLMSYNLLISAKLEWFMVGLEHKCTNSR